MSKIILGKAGSKSVSIDLELLLRTRLLVQANSGGGKSFLLRRLAEQLWGKVQVILIDREGEFASLREKFGYVLIGEGGEAAADIRSARLLAERLLECKASAICDLYEAFRTKPGDRRAWVRAFLEGLIDAPKHLWRNVVVIVDEAHLFAPQETPKAASMIEREVISGCKDAMIALATVGRKRGLCAVWATQRLAKLDKDASSELFNRLVGMTIEDVDVDRAADLMSVSRDEKTDFKKSLRDLEPGSFYAFGRAISKQRVLLRVGPVETTHPEPGYSKQSAEPPPMPEQVKHLLPKLKDLPQEAETKARTEAELKAEVRSIRLQLAAAQKDLVLEKSRAAQAASRTPAPAPTAPAAAKPRIVKVDVPVVSPRVVTRLEKLVAAVAKASDKLQVLGKPVEEAARELRTSIASVLAVDSARILEAKTREIHARQLGGRAGSSHGNGTAGAKSGRMPLVAPQAPRILPTTAPRPVSRALPAAAAHPDPAAGDRIPNPQLRILTSLVQFETIGIQEVPRPMLAGWMGLKGGGSYMNNLGSLSTRGLIQYVFKNVQLTDAGRGVAPLSDEEITTEGLLKHCLDAVSGPQGQILSHLHQLHPEWIMRDELIAALGLKGGGSFMNNLGTLHTACMIDYDPQQGMKRIKCAEWLFVYAESAASSGRGRR